MAAVLNIISILLFTTALVLFGIRTIRSYKRNGIKGGIIAKGNWGLWFAGLAFLFLGLLCHSFADQYAPKDSAFMTHETAHPDTTSDPAVFAVARAFGDDTASSQSAQATPTALAPVQPSVPEAGSAAALAEQGAAPASPSPAAIPADGPALASALAIAASVAKEDPNDIAFTNGEDTTSLQTPVFAGRVSQDGYPVYALQCDFQKQQCKYHNDMGNPLVEPMADSANGLTPIRNADVINTAYHCQENICMDSQGQVVGTISLEMRNYLANHPSS